MNSAFNLSKTDQRIIEDILYKIDFLFSITQTNRNNVITKEINIITYLLNSLVRESETLPFI
jgi:hypothetical protein